ncbi:unnamed protein product [Heligmosomoides polygyrus]|uniref:Uncharacterized protein n=1 Tax=Heligmosomoides polygyrus TaxID=6339 RepID=A0A3P8BMX3_HELPZ|nr:unnamed protein product [Heligmosomoides polygyrus]
MASDAYDKVLTMVDSTVNNAWQLLNHLQLYSRDNLNDGRSDEGQLPYLPMFNRRTITIDGVLDKSWRQLLHQIVLIRMKEYRLAVLRMKTFSVGKLRRKPRKDKLPKKAEIPEKAQEVPEKGSEESPSSSLKKSKKTGMRKKPKSPKKAEKISETESEESPSASLKKPKKTGMRKKSKSPKKAEKISETESEESPSASLKKPKKASPPKKAKSPKKAKKIQEKEKAVEIRTEVEHMFMNSPDEPFEKPEGVNIERLVKARRSCRYSHQLEIFSSRHLGNEVLVIPEPMLAVKEDNG